MNEIPPAQTTRWRPVLLLTLVFLGGGACGIAGTLHIIRHHAQHAMQNPHTLAQHITGRLSAYLELNEQQAAQVQEIIYRRHLALGDIRREIQPRLEQELNILEDEIAGVLDEQQKARWHAHASAMRAQWLPPIPQTNGSP